MQRIGHGVPALRLAPNKAHLAAIIPSSKLPTPAKVDEIRQLRSSAQLQRTTTSAAPMSLAKATSLLRTEVKRAGSLLKSHRTDTTYAIPINALEPDLDEPPKDKLTFVFDPQTHAVCLYNNYRGGIEFSELLHTEYRKLGGHWGDYELSHHAGVASLGMLAAIQRVGSLHACSGQGCELRCCLVPLDAVDCVEYNECGKGEYAQIDPHMYLRMKTDEAITKTHKMDPTTYNTLKEKAARLSLPGGIITTTEGKKCMEFHGVNKGHFPQPATPMRLTKPFAQQRSQQDWNGAECCSSSTPDPILINHPDGFPGDKLTFSFNRHTHAVCLYNNCSGNFKFSEMFLEEYRKLGGNEYKLLHHAGVASPHVLATVQKIGSLRACSGEGCKLACYLVPVDAVDCLMYEEYENGEYVHINRCLYLMKWMDEVLLTQDVNCTIWEAMKQRAVRLFLTPGVKKRTPEMKRVMTFPGLIGEHMTLCKVYDNHQAVNRADDGTEEYFDDSDYHGYGHW